MSIGQALQATLTSNGDTKKKAAEIAMVQESTMGKYINGKRRMPVDVMKKVNEHYDNPMLNLALSSNISGVGVYLDLADLHPSNVHLKTEEEVGEAVKAMSLIRITKRANQLGEADRVQAKETIMECIEAITALSHYVGILCREYGFSLIEMWNEHRKELRAKEYIS